MSKLIKKLVLGLIGTIVVSTTLSSVLLIKENDRLNENLFNIETRVSEIEIENDNISNDNSNLKNDNEVLSKELEEIKINYEELNRAYQSEITPVSFNQ